MLHTHVPVEMPVWVIHGRRPGPRLFISAAIHGDELNGIEIIRRVRARPLTGLKGTLLLVPVVNVFGLLQHSRYLPDRRDGSGQWLRVFANDEQRVWLAADALTCLNIDPTTLEVDSAPPTPIPTHTPTDMPTATPTITPTPSITFTPSPTAILPPRQTPVNPTPPKSASSN